MSMTEARLASGGLIDRSKPLSFRFDGKAFTGFAGDTLASALLANGVVLTGRSFKYHRPRGIVGFGIEDPGSIVQLAGEDGSVGLPATAIPLREGLDAHSVNCWPSPAHDIFAFSQVFASLLPAGFYYKTFMWPGWHAFEPLIRRAAGLARVPAHAAPNQASEIRHGHCDVLVVGAGPAGLMAAWAAAEAGARVVLVDADRLPGGSLNHGDVSVGGVTAAAWARDLAARLDAMGNVTRLAGATVWAHREHGLVVITERDPPLPELRQRTWQMRARRIVIAAGAIERMLVFEDNDRPGVMLASAARSYLHRHAVRPGRRALVFTNNASAYATARDLAAAGIEVAAIVDSREQPDAASLAVAAGIEVLAGHVVTHAHGSRRLRGVTVAPRQGRGARRIACDLLCLSGGWTPSVHLFSQARGRLRYDEGTAAMVPDTGPATTFCAGSALGLFDLQAVLASGAEAGRRAARECGHAGGEVAVPQAGPAPAYAVEPLWCVDACAASTRAFVDLQNDVTAADIILAVREGYGAVEHVKRYTTAGMGVDQGKTGNMNVIGILAGRVGTTPAAIGTTTYRSPYEPIEFGAIAGPREGTALLPYRHTPVTPWHVRHGAVMYEAGARWRRPGYYPLPGESLDRAVERESRAVREAVGVYDGSPLGKIEIWGRDALALIEMAYTNGFASLRAGGGRYGIMMTDDGLIADDGVTFRLGDNHYMMSTSTANAEAVYRRLEEFLQCERPDWDVTLTPVTSQWCNATICGPAARELLADLDPDIDICNAAFPFMSLRDATVAGLPARIARVSFTGELSFEINVARRHGLALWERVMEAGSRHRIVPVGSEANHVLRVEKGFLSLAHEADGTADPYDLGMGWIVSKTKQEFIGKRAMEIRRSTGHRRRELVGLLPHDPDHLLPEAAPLTPGGRMERTEGLVTACVRSVAQRRVVALGLLLNGRARIGETAHVRVKDEVIAVTVTSPCFYDPDGLRLRS
ncbi:MAG: sarcosine oxidase subunit alpha family protein [Rhodospirillales bacterium]|nr:sarcosine oxidase subunit alpha family protein [Rhodospirillales bacterium]